MSRFSDYDEYEGEPRQILAIGRWERNARAVLASKRGRKALAELREALDALPEHKLIEGALCTIGSQKRHAALIAEAEADATRSHEGAVRYAAEHPEYDFAQRIAAQPVEPDLDVADDLARKVAAEGEGVCAVGAYAWYRKVRAGMDPAEAFDALPELLDSDPDNGGLNDTAKVGESAGMAFTLAWELAYRNDETYRDKTPEERWQAFADWLDERLAVTT